MAIPNSKTKRGIIMLQFIAEQNVLLYTMAVVGILGAISQAVLYFMYGRLIRDMGNVTGIPKGKFMKQLKQRYTGGRRMNEEIFNTKAFVRRSIMEFEYAGMNLHQWRRLGGIAFTVCTILGAAGYFWTQSLNMAQGVQQNYLWAILATALLLVGIYGLTDISYKRKYLETGLQDILENSGIGRRYQEVDLPEPVPRPMEEKEKVKTVKPITQQKTVSVKTTPMSSRQKRDRTAETQAQKDKRELKENLAKLKEGISETAVVREREKERNTEILKQMDPAEQERVIREVLKEFLS